MSSINALKSIQNDESGYRLEFIKDTPEEVIKEARQAIMNISIEGVKTVNLELADSSLLVAIEDSEGLYNI